MSNIMKALPKKDKNEVSVPNIRWILYTKNGKTIVENHDHGRTWRKVYKDNYGNIEALCFQLIPESTKYFIPVSPFGEYWTFEDMEVGFGGDTKHTARNICSKKRVQIDKNDINKSKVIWDVITIDAQKNVFRRELTSEDIGYSTLK